MTLQEAKQIRNLHRIVENYGINEDVIPVSQMLLAILKSKLKEESVVQDILFDFSKNEQSSNIFVCEMGTENNLALCSELEHEMATNEEFNQYFLNKVRDLFKAIFKTEDGCTFIKSCGMSHEHRVYPHGIMEVYLQVKF